MFYAWCGFEQKEAYFKQEMKSDLKDVISQENTIDDAQNLTDSRRRLDMWLMEEDKWKEANKNLQLEKKSGSNAPSTSISICQFVYLRISNCSARTNKIGCIEIQIGRLKVIKRWGIYRVWLNRVTTQFGRRNSDFGLYKIETEW